MNLLQLKHHPNYSGRVKNKQESYKTLSLNTLGFFSPYHHPSVRIIFH